MCVMSRDLMKMMESMGKIEEHGDNIMERHNLFFWLLLSGIHHREMFT